MRRHGSYEISPNWTMLKKGAPCLTPLGYLRINVDGKRILLHRHVMEQHLGRPLNAKERVHHINGDKTDNRIENLELFANNSEHIRQRHGDRPRIGKSTIDAIVERVFDEVRHPVCFCGNPPKARGLCAKHYLWAWKHRLLER